MNPAMIAFLQRMLQGAGSGLQGLGQGFASSRFGQELGNFGQGFAATRGLHTPAMEQFHDLTQASRRAGIRGPLPGGGNRQFIAANTAAGRIGPLPDGGNLVGTAPSGGGLAGGLGTALGIASMFFNQGGSVAPVPFNEKGGSSLPFAPLPQPTFGQSALPFAPFPQPTFGPSVLPVAPPPPTFGISPNGFLSLQPRGGF